MTTSRLLLEQLASRGNATALSFLATLHSFGLGVPPNQARALVYHTLAARGANASSASLLALGYRHYASLGVPLSCEEAAQAYVRVARAVAADFKRAGGRTFLKVNLASEDSPGGSVRAKQDILQYYMYVASRGDAEAQLLLARLYEHGSLGLDQDVAAAVALYQQCALFFFPFAGVVHEIHCSFFAFAFALLLLLPCFCFHFCFVPSSSLVFS